MPAEEFDIYQTAEGYTAVTNPVRRQILEALAEGPKELPELVERTGKAKPTLSNLHMKELLAGQLIEEAPHPTDGRRKIFRLAARRIGSSNVPIEQLRASVRQYVTSSPLVFTLPLTAVVDVLLASPGLPREGLRAQGRALGTVSAHVFQANGARDLLTGVAGFWEREGLARVGKIDLDRMEVEVDLADRLSASRPQSEAAGALLAGFVEGLLAARLGTTGGVTARLGAGGRLTLVLPRKP